MKEVKLVLRNLPPQPRNATHQKTSQGIRLSDMARAFQEDIRERLSRTGKRDLFRDCESLTLTFIVYTPVDQFLTKSGQLSKTSIDLDAHKLFLDELAKYFGFNDGLVWDFNPIKLPIEGDEWVFKVHITGEEKTTWPVANIATLTANLPEYQILD
jgi:hypothetical protein